MKNKYAYDCLIVRARYEVVKMELWGFITYTWLPNNTWQMSAYTTIFRITNRQIAIYIPDGPTRWYDSSVTQFGSDYHRRILLSVTYTFNYGRKVNQSGELSGEKNISTSILR